MTTTTSVVFGMIEDVRDYGVMISKVLIWDEPVGSCIPEDSNRNATRVSVHINLEIAS